MKLYFDGIQMISKSCFLIGCSVHKCSNKGAATAINNTFRKREIIQKQNFRFLGNIS